MSYSPQKEIQNNAASVGMAFSLFLVIPRATLLDNETKNQSSVLGYNSRVCNNVGTAVLWESIGPTCELF